jgi:hypothetical protein
MYLYVNPAELGGWSVFTCPICCLTPSSTRKFDYQTTEVYVRIPASRASKMLERPKTCGPRQSKRLREVREYGERRYITITKQMTVKDMKVAVSVATDSVVLFAR